MESTTKYENDHNAPPLPSGLPNNALKLEILDDDFCVHNLLSLSSSSSSKSYLQEFHDLDQFPLHSSSFNPDIGFQTNCFDPFDPFFHDSCSDFVLYKIDPFDQEINGSSGSSTGAAMQNFKNDGFLNFQSKEEVLMDIETSLNIDCHDPKPLSFVFPDDQSSCVTTADHNIGCHKKDVMKRSKNIKTQNSNSNDNEPVSTKKSGRGRKKLKSAKGQWTIEEDKLLIHLVEKFGVRKWSQIAQMLKGRIGKQCRERWHNHLRPDIKKDIWTEEEDRILIEAHAEVGNKWAEITKKLPGRTENSIKNHWNATKRRQFSRRKCRTKWPRPSSLLQNYIKSLNFEKGSSSRSGNGAPPLPAATHDHDETLNASSVNKLIQPLEIEFCPADQMVPDYEFDEVPVFSFDDDHDLFEGGSIESFIDNIPVDRPPEIDDNQLCFDEELPFDLQSEVKKEVDFFDGTDIELMDMIP